MKITCKKWRENLNHDMQKVVLGICIIDLMKGFYEEKFSVKFITVSVILPKIRVKVFVLAS